MNYKTPVYDLKFWLTLIGQVVFAFGLFIVLSEWRASDMREEGESIRPITSPTLSGDPITFPVSASDNSTTLVYFFAPWCRICDLSIGNLNLIKNEFATEVNILIVALDYQSIDEVRNFIDDKALPYPVILGDSRWAQEYAIKGFPSYYIIDHTGTVLSRTMGYSSTAGMLARLALAD